MADDNWDDFRFVLALYRQGSIAAAALHLGVNDTTVARRLSQVECALGTRLFERERGRALPTAEADAVIRRLVSIDDEFQQLRDEASGANRRVDGTVRITAVPMIANRVLVPRLHDIQNRYPDLELELVVDSALLGIAMRRDADIAIRGARPDSDGEAITRKLGTMSYGLYCHESFTGTDDSIPWVAYTQRITKISRVQADWMDEQLKATGCTARTRVNDGETLLQCVLAGLGKALIADALARQNPTLRRLELSDHVPSRELWMLVHPSFREVKRIEVTASWLADEIRAFLKSPD